MSTVPSWLRSQRKSDLVELADEAGLKDYESLKKSDLEVALDEHLRANESSLAKKSRFSPFYTRTGTGSSSSPVKRDSAIAAPNSEGESKPAKPRARRVTKVADEVSNTVTDIANRTPRRNLALARSVPLPPSPAVVADAIDRRTAVLRHKVGNAWTNAGLTERAEGVRESLSTVVSIEALIFAIEAFSLRSEVLPQRYAFTIPAIALLHTPAIPVSLPDLFLLLTSSFWSPFTLWLLTSLAVPLAFAYFFNLTLKSKSGASHSRSHSSHTVYRFDPLTFNIAKALVAFLVYVQDVKFGGFVSEDNVDRIRSALPGGAFGIILGASIGGLATIYEAVLKK
ncbi:MAG: hypothetical protein M1825_000924 [Sarcosagium campestre]|nr:MAG: hypothetical protein M1825_000924 [Sarcosagium campestre]